jgi:hypothetical protein
MVQIIDRTTQPSLHWPGIRAVFGAYAELPTVYDKFYEVRKSSKAHEEDVETFNFGLAQVQAELAPVVFDRTSEGIKVRYRHVAYGLAFGVSREENDDNLYPQVGARRVRALNYSMRQTKEIVCHLPLNLAFDAVLGLRPDGVPLISNAHPSPAGNWSNVIATPADVSELAIESLVTQIAYAKDGRGLRANFGIKRMIITPSQEFEVHRILGSVLQSGTQTNNVNVLRSRSVIPEVVSSPYLDDTDAWFIQTDCPEGLTVFNRTSDIEIQEDSSFSTGAKLVKAYMRFSAGVSDARSIFGSPGA